MLSLTRHADDLGSSVKKRNIKMYFHLRKTSAKVDLTLTPFDLFSFKAPISHQFQVKRDHVAPANISTVVAWSLLN